MENKILVAEDILRVFYKTNPLFGMIVNSVSALVEQNAMNHTPTDEELEKLQSEMEQVKRNLEVFACEAKEKSALYELRMNETGNEAERLTEEQLKLTESMDQMIKLREENEVRLSEKRGELDGAKNLLESNRKELSGLSQKADKLKRQYNDQKLMYLIPFYGWGLAIADEIDDVRGDVRRAENRCREQSSHCEDLSRACEKLDENIHNIIECIADIERQICAKKGEISAVTEKMGEFKEQMVYWEDKFIRTSGLLDKIQAGKTSPDVLMKILELMDQMG